MKTAAVILAAGHGTRMHSKLHKVLHPIVGKPMLWHSLNSAKQAGSQKPVVVIGHAADEVQAAIGADAADFVIQAEQHGTGHDVQQAEQALKGKVDQVLVMYGDMPLWRPATLQMVIEMQEKNDGPMTLATIEVDDPRGFGRVARKPDGSLLAIVEEAQCTPEQIAIKELNVSLYCFEASWLWDALRRVELSPKGEYYLTDTVALAVADGGTVITVSIQDHAEAIGVNTRIHLSEAEAMMRRRINHELMLSGVTLIDPDHTYIEPDVKIGQDTVIRPNTWIRGKTVIGEGCDLGPNTIITECIIGNECVVLASVLEKAVLENHVDIGPFGRLRKGAHLADHVHLGNFGEVKNSYLSPGVKMGHFSYVGDAHVGENANIGCGTITCNFDGANKNKTIIGNDAFIGSGTMLVAPLELGENSITGAGSVVTHDVPANSTVVGVPARIHQKGKNSKAT